HQALRFAWQLTSAVEHVHANGRFLRDIKPDNSFVIDGDLVKLFDFGAMTAAGDPQITSEDAYVGSPGYIAPEQPRGTCDARTDIWALGALLYEMLTGKRLLAQGIAHPSVDARVKESLKGFSPDLVALVSRAVSQEPEQRQQTATEFRLALEALSG